MTTKRRRGRKTMLQLVVTKVAETLMIDEARESLFLTQHTITVINTATMSTATAIKILVVLSLISGSCPGCVKVGIIKRYAPNAISAEMVAKIRR
jgi:hypothetical protein